MCETAVNIITLVHSSHHNPDTTWLADVTIHSTGNLILNVHCGHTARTKSMTHFDIQLKNYSLKKHWDGLVLIALVRMCTTLNTFWTGCSHTSFWVWFCALEKELCFLFWYHFTRHQSTAHIRVQAVVMIPAIISGHKPQLPVKWLRSHQLSLLKPHWGADSLVQTCVLMCMVDP